MICRFGLPEGFIFRFFLQSVMRFFSLNTEVDLYDQVGRPLFGELTFTPHGEYLDTTQRARREYKNV